MYDKLVILGDEDMQPLYCRESAIGNEGLGLRWLSCVQSVSHISHFMHSRFRPIKDDNQFGFLGSDSWQTLRGHGKLAALLSLSPSLVGGVKNVRTRQDGILV